ncbi:hypothetical protein V5O48_018501, partial [Marasmius crinis-equi]
APFFGYPPYGYPPAPFTSPVHGYSTPAMWGSPPHGGKSRSDDIGSSPIPADSNMTAEQFCEHAGLPMHWAARLTELGFSLEADLQEIPSDLWEKKGFMFLEVTWVKKAFRKVCREIKSA